MESDGAPEVEPEPGPLTEHRRDRAPGAPEQVSEWDVARLKAVLQDAHLNVLVGAGTSAGFIPALGNVEDALTEIAASNAQPQVKALARASVQAHFFKSVIEPNLGLVARDASAARLIAAYGAFGRSLNRLLLRRRSTLLSKRVNVFTTNIDLAFETAFEEAGLRLNDGAVGRFRPRLDTSTFGTLTVRTSSRYEHRSEVPTFDLLKLHGSVDWTPSTDPNFPIHFDSELSTLTRIQEALDRAAADLVPIDATTNVDPEEILALAGSLKHTPETDAFASAYNRLAIVNPEKTKFETTVLSQTYYELIRRFANELERENSVLIVHGFSFRDEHLRELTLRAAYTNPTLQVLVFAYTQDAAADIAELLGSDQAKNRNIAVITGDELDLTALVEQWLDPLLPDIEAPSD